MKTEAIADAILSFLGRKKPPPQLVKPFTIKCRGLACDGAEIEGLVYWFDKTPLCATCFPTVERKATLRVRAMIPFALAGLLLAGGAHATTGYLAPNAALVDDIRVVRFNATRARIFDARCQLNRPTAYCPKGVVRTANGYVGYLDSQDARTVTAFNTYWSTTRPYATQDWWDDLVWAFKAGGASQPCNIATVQAEGTFVAIFICFVPPETASLPFCAFTGFTNWLAMMDKMALACDR